MYPSCVCCVLRVLVSLRACLLSSPYSFLASSSLRVVSATLSRWSWTCFDSFFTDDLRSVVDLLARSSVFLSSSSFPFRLSTYASALE